MEYVIAALAVFWVRNLVQTWVTAPVWSWNLSITLLATGAQLLIDPSQWYWGLGIAGLAVLLQRTEDLLLVACDRVRVDLLRITSRTTRRPPL